MTKSAATDGLQRGQLNRMSDLVSYFARSAPWTLVSSLGAGLSSYVVMVLLARYHGLEAVGQFRLLVSIVAMLGLTTLADSGKILIKYLVQSQSGIVRPLLFNRMRWSLLCVAAGLITAYAFHVQGNELAPAIAFASLLLPVLHTTNLYIQINQARRQFRRNAFINTAQYGSIIVLAAAWMVLEWNIILFFMVFYSTTAIFNSWFMSRQPEVYEAPGPNSGKYVGEAWRLSASGLFQVVLEHADKFLISYFLGLEALGLYAIGVSTGRLLLHFVKPLLVIYLADLVESRFSVKMQIVSFGILTVIGCVVAYLLQFYMMFAFGPDKMASYPIAALIVAGMGVYFVGVTKYYSSVYYKDASLKVPMITNLITTPLIVLYLLASLTLGGTYALVLCAISYPLREFTNIVVISAVSAVLRSRHVPDQEVAGTV